MHISVERADIAEIMIIPHQAPVAEKDRTVDGIADRLLAWTGGPRGYLRAIAVALIS